MKITQAFFILTALTLASVQCGGPNVNSDVLSLMLKFRIQSFDPVESTDETSEYVLGLLHRRLFSQSVDGKTIHDLVVLERVTPNGLVLNLVQNAKFQNGESLTAADVVYSLQRLQNSGRQSWVLEDISAVKEVSTYSVLLEFFPQRRPVLSVLRAKLSLPKCGIYSSKAHKKDNSFVGAGRYIASQNTAAQLKLTRTTQPGKNIVFSILPDEAGRYFSFARDKLDIYEASGIFRFLPWDQNNFVEHKLHSSVVAYAAIVPAQDSELNREEIRRAINARFPREELCRGTLLNACRAAEYPVPEIFAAPPSVSVFEQNKKILLKNTENVTIFTPPDRERQTVAVVLAEVLEQMGFKASIQTLDLPAMIQANNKKVPGIYLLKWMADYPHAENFLKPLFHSSNAGPGGNRSWTIDAELDAAIENMGEDPQKIQKVQELIQKKSPWIFIGFWSNYFRVRKNLPLARESRIALWSPDLIP